MLRRNLVLAVLAVPATAVSATLWSSIDPRHEAAAPPQVSPVATDSVAHAVVAAMNPPSRAAAPAAPFDEIQPSPPAAVSQRAERLVVPMNIAVDIQAQEESAVAAVGVAARDAAARHVPRRAPASAQARPLNVNAARATSSRTSAQTGSMSLARVSESLPPPTSATGLRAAGELMPADCGIPEFEPSPLSMVFGDAAAGQPIELALTIINEDVQADVFACHVSIFAIGDDGESLGEVRPAADIAVAVDGESTTMQSLPPLQTGELLPWLSQTQSFNVIVAAVGQASGDEYSSDNYLYAPVPYITVTLTPDSDVQTGDWVKVTVESDGPLGMSLSDVKIRLNGGVQLLQPGQTVFEDQTASDVIISLGDLAAGSSFTHEEWFVAVDPTWALMCVQLEAVEILPQFNCAEIWDDSEWSDPDDGGDDSDGDPGEPGEQQRAVDVGTGAAIAVGIGFLVHIKNAIANPERMMLGL